MRILALDLGTHFGWAEIENGQLIDSGHIDLKKSNGALRYAKFREIVVKSFIDPKRLDLSRSNRFLDHIAYEKVMRHQGTTAAHMYGAFEALTMLIGFERNIPVHGYGVGEIKKFATGKGNAPKEKMIEAAKRFKPGLENDNEADAIFIGLLAYDRLTQG